MDRPTWAAKVMVCLPATEAPIWARAAMVAARPGDSAALAVFRLAVEAFGGALTIGSRWQVDEAVIEAERERGFAAGYAACMAERGRLRAV